MATASASKSKYYYKQKNRDFAYCSLCVQQYTDPRLLSRCTHTFCLQCIIQLHSKSKDPGNIICPLCTAKNPVPDNGLEELRKNTATTKMLHMMQNARMEALLDEPEVFCDACKNEDDDESDNTKADLNSHCEQCDKNLCVACADRHKSDELFKSHTWCAVEVPEPNCEHMYCKRHPEEEMKVHCDECEVLLCPVCSQEEPHNNHKQSDISVIAEVHRQQLAELKIKLIQKTAKDEAAVTDLKKREADLHYARARISEGTKKAKAVIEKWRDDNLRVVAEYEAKVDEALEQNEEEEACLQRMLDMVNARLASMGLE